MALTVFLMQWHDGTYREGFLDYVRDAYRGRISDATGRKLQDRVGERYATLESQFLDFLKGPEHVEVPKPETSAGGTDRPKAGRDRRSEPCPEGLRAIDRAD